jgi:hypothetical protein
MVALLKQSGKMYRQEDQVGGWLGADQTKTRLDQTRQLQFLAHCWLWSGLL